MNQTNNVPIWEKQNLTIEECAAYAHIGKNKIGDLINNSNCQFWFYVGNKRLINRKLFDEYIQELAKINGSL